MSALHYLTVQDMLWINHRVTGKVLPFRYDVLEEATFYQYGYGTSTDLANQAAKLLSGFPKKSPFPNGNEATALVGCVAFLRANGKDAVLDRKAAEGWIKSGGVAPELKAAEGEEVHGQPDVRAIIEGVLADYGDLLGASEPAAA